MAANKETEVEKLQAQINTLKEEKQVAVTQLSKSQEDLQKLQIENARLVTENTQLKAQLNYSRELSLEMFQRNLDAKPPQQPVSGYNFPNSEWVFPHKH